MDYSQLLEQYYGIQTEALYSNQPIRYKAKGYLYTIINATKLTQEMLIEFRQMSLHLQKFGERGVSSFCLSKNGKFLETVEGQDFIVLRNPVKKGRTYSNMGRKLAKFHYRGRFIQEKMVQTNRMGTWRFLWEKRLEQLEGFYHRLLQQSPSDPFDILFVDIFPYYMGMAENAIQYVADTELDEDPMESDAGTICHERFRPDTWGKNDIIKNPFDWVFDHAARDISEWIRYQFWHQQTRYKAEIKQFIKGYQSIQPLTVFSWRLIFARLMFPLHFFECVEDYFMTPSPQRKKELEEQLTRYIRDTKEYEHFLASFYQLAEVPVKRIQIPVVPWLLR
ncbi:spore coat putative kinase YutH [Bacillus smithii]|uniref:spore coat putative kinase YutH n=1 Tax=Bacillus smithii TaxID=1479 RepID=UPI003D1B6D3D